MNPLRKLAKGYEYSVSPARRVLIFASPGPRDHDHWWDYDSAPASCFADEPAEPIRNGNRVVVTGGERVGEHGVVEDSLDGDGESVLWVEFGTGKGQGKHRKNLRHERDDERPAEKKPEPLRANFPPPQYHGGLPVLPIAKKEPEPVIGCKLLRADGGSLVGEGGRRLFYPVGEGVEDKEGAGVFVAVEGGLESAWPATTCDVFVAAFECWEKTSRAGEGVPPPQEVVPGLVCGLLPQGVYTYRRVRRLPEIPMDRLHPHLRKEVEEWQAKQEPKPPPRKYINDQAVENACGKHRYIVRGAEWNPLACRWMYELCPDGDYPTMHLWENEIRPCSAPPRKYEDGQWVRLVAPRENHRGIVVSARHCHEKWQYEVCIDGREVWFFDQDIRPCPPPLTEAQRRLLPGDKVSVRKKRWDAEGKPIDAFSPTEIFTITVMSLLPGQKCTEVDLESPGDDFHTYLWNLDPVEGGGASHD